MRIFYLLFAIFAATLLNTPAIQAQIDKYPDTRSRQLEERLSEVKGQERFEILVDLSRLAMKKGNNTKVLRFAEEARELLPTVNDPENELLLYFTLTFAYSNMRDLDSALEAAGHLEELARDQHNTRNLAFYFLKMGDISRYQAKHAQALEYYAEALQLYESLGININTARVLNNTALVHKAKGDYVKALKSYLLARDVFNKTGYLAGVALTSKNIGDIHMVLEQVKEAETAFQQSLTTANQAGVKAYVQADALQGLGDIALSQEDPQQALIFFQQALDVYLNIDGYLTRRVKAYNSVGKAWSAIGIDNKAMDYYNKALALASDIKDYSGQVHSWLQIALIHHQQGDFNTAIDICEQALQIARELNYVSDIRILLDTLRLFYADTGQHHKAYEALKEYEILNNEALNEESRRTLARMQAGFEASEREKAIELLENDQVFNQARLERQQDTQRLLLTSFVVLLILLALLFNWYRLKTRAVAMAIVVEDERKISRGLREVDRLKDEFLANTSHELRTPLNGIIGLADSMQLSNNNLTRQQQSELALISNSGKRLSNLVNDILDFSLLKNKQLNLNIQTIDLYSLSKTVVTICTSLIADKPLKLINSIEADLPLVSADEDRVQQILYNLIGNAIKFNDHGSIQIEAEVIEKNWVKLSVIDSGPGITEKQIDDIFKPFERVSNRSINNIDGVGLGLSISRQLVELFGGYLKVESKQGQGSHFYFTLPISSDQARAPAVSDMSKILNQPRYQLPQQTGKTSASTNSHPEEKTQRQHILVVDDDLVNLQVAQNHLDTEGFSVTTVTDGVKALELIDAGKQFDLVLLDVMMPGISGFEVCRCIRHRYTSVQLPVIIVTAKNQLSDLVQGLDIGANDYLAKPFTREELLARTHAQLKVRSAHLALQENALLKKELEAHKDSILNLDEEDNTESEQIDLLNNKHQLIVELMNDALDLWVRQTSTTKIELARSSKLWKVYMDDDGWERTQTLDRYLQIKTIPKQPRIQQVIKTVNYVLERCPDNAGACEKLQQKLKQLL